MMINNNNNNIKRKSSELAAYRIIPFSDDVDTSNGGLTKHVRRKRLELRRLKNICSSNNNNNNNNNNKIVLVDRNYGITTPSVCSPSVVSASSYNATEASSEEETDVRAGSRTMSSRTGSNTLSGDMCESRLYGKISVIGRRRELEDAVTVELGLVSVSSGKYDYFGVFDGHGGFRVAHACRDLLHHLVVGEVERAGEGEGEEVDWEKVMVASFGKMDEEVVASGAVTGSVGSTAVVAIVGEEVVVVANCGDSRAVLSRGGLPVPLSNDHKPDRPDELERIEVSGGRVINWNGQRVLGVLATSRSIGDQYLKPYVIAQPEVTVSKRNEGDEFLILASDGLWDVITNELACLVVRKCLNGRLRRRFSQGSVQEETCSTSRRETDQDYETRATEAAAVLAELAMARGSKDNISVVVVELNKHGRCHEE